MTYKVISGKLVKIHRDSNKIQGRKQSVLNEALVHYDREPESLHPLKGDYKGRCNRTACQDPEAVVWYNTGTRKYYCWHCAYLINTDGCQRYNEPNICHRVTGFDSDGNPQFDPTLPLTNLRDYHPTKEERHERRTS